MAVLGWMTFFIVQTIFYGFVLQVLWGWFVTGVFGVRALNIPEALGLALLVGYLTKQYIPDNRPMIKQAIYGATYTATVLLIGWIYHLFI